MDWKLALPIIVPSATAVLVVLITFLSNAWLKNIDAKQRQADHKHELSKVLLVRKLEAGEAFIASIVALINQYDGLRILLIAGMPGAEDNEYFAHIRKAFESLQAATTAMMTKERNAAYMYFNSRLLEQDEGSEIPRIIQLEKEMVNIMIARGEIEQLLYEEGIDRRSKDNVLWSYKENQKDFSRLREEYAEAIVKHRAYLRSVCDAIRQALAKYDLPQLIN
ncbi:hypothetical protein Q5H93_21625 [Hymenobacter sp. ASUV-10]|uniref:DUF4760 domain-containing protein n=1 Tax=Hymenobacter aranciens TaxID=3063996 RepID=A0ABT9BHS9_9BACT|nr:hypothetical protein [Hymenobacter sp. ASUV-10]MDO7877360.1 hypothetical protein [Hymenobacter sp. ASUV-10]